MIKNSFRAIVIVLLASLTFSAMAIAPASAKVAALGSASGGGGKA